MENRKGTAFHITKRPAQKIVIFVFLFSILLSLTGCGAPGEPTAPAPPIPTPISDLSARQLGDGVQLSFSLPSNTITGTKLTAPPAVEFLRGGMKPDGTADPKSFRLVYTIPGAMVENYRVDEHLRFVDPIAPEEIKTHSGATFTYVVRTRASKKRASGDSNVVSLRLFPVPERIASVEARVTETAIELSWPAPTRTSAGEPLPAAISYRVYRSEMNPAGTGLTPPIAPHGKREVESGPLASSDSNTYRDSSFSFEHKYMYTVRSAIQVEGNSVESADSEPVTVTPHDTFPPAAPQGIVAAVLPGETAGALAVELSWSINLETDLAGYHVYRSEQEGARGELVTPDLLPTPAVRDTSVEPGHRYWYTVSALDRSGNESVPSAPIAVDVTQPSK
jgi:hypothetical protein